MNEIREPMNKVRLRDNDSSVSPGENWIIKTPKKNPEWSLKFVMISYVKDLHLQKIFLLKKMSSLLLLRKPISEPIGSHKVSQMCDRFIVSAEI